MSTEVMDAYDAVCADPYDDQRREALANACEGPELERSRFIRLQIERARLPNWDKKAIELELEERALLAEHETRWRAHLPVIEGVEWGRFERGAISSVAIGEPGTSSRTEKWSLRRLRSRAHSCGGHGQASFLPSQHSVRCERFRWLAASSRAKTCVDWERAPSRKRSAK